MKPNPSKDHQPLTKQILMDTLVDFWEQIAYPTLQTKANQTTLLKIQADVQDIKRRLLDFEADTPSQSDLRQLSRRLNRLEQQFSN